MKKTGIVLVSHSKEIVSGTNKLIQEMIQKDSLVEVFEAGGTEDGRLGTSAIKVLEALNKCRDFENVLIFYDIGSSKMSSEMAIEMFDEEGPKVSIIEAPLVEGAFAAAVTAANTNDIDMILSECMMAKAS